MSTREEIEATFSAMKKSNNCPSCDIAFNDFAIEWGEAWSEGRSDLMREIHISERDGPFKIKCEFCDKKSWISCFAKTATLA